MFFRRPLNRLLQVGRGYHTITAEEAALRVEKSGHTQVKVSAVDIDGVLRGKFLSAEKAVSALRGDQTIPFCSVVFGWDMTDKCYTNINYEAAHTGYPDIGAVIDANSYRELPWENGKPFFMLDFVKGTNDPTPLLLCPRQLLKHVLDQIEQEVGAGAYTGPELEWYNFKEDMHTMHQKGYQKAIPMSPGMFGYSLLRTGQNYEFFNRVFDELGMFGVDIEGLHCESGPGVMEAAIRYNHPVKSSDNCALLKYGVKIVASELGVFPCFMAKPFAGLPGSSGHMHQSLYSLDTKKNLFYDSKDPNQMSELFKHYVAGQLHCLPHLLPIFCPTINSYKRLVEGYWAPVTPTWGVENRTTSVRVIPGGEKGTRLETRIGGADSNPYLVAAASLASGLYGIRHKLQLQDVVKGTTANVKSQDRLPRDLSEAVKKMRASPIANELFGEFFTDHFASTREWEVQQFQTAVTDWEMSRYSEII